MTLRSGTGAAALVAALALQIGGCGGPVGSLAGTGLYTPDDEQDESPRVQCAATEASPLPGQAELDTPAVSPLGSGFVIAWVEREGHDRVLRVQRVESDLTPAGDPTSLDSGGELPLAISVASCGDRVWVAWELQGRTADSIRVATLATDLTAIANREADRLGRRPVLACAGSVAALAYSARVDGIEDVVLRWVSAAGEVSEPTTVSGETDSARDPSIACSPESCALAWSDLRDGAPEIFVATVEPGRSTAGEPTRVTEPNNSVSGAGGAYEPAISVRAGGGLVVAWHDSRGDAEHEIYVAVLDARGRRRTEARLSSAPGSSTDAATIACAGTDIVAWRDRRRGAQVAMVAAVDGRGARSSPVVAISGDAAEASSPALACAGDVLLAAWTEATEHRAQVRLARISCTQ